MEITIKGDTARGFSWSDGISTTSGYDSPQEALAAYLARSCRADEPEQGWPVWADTPAKRERNQRHQARRNQDIAAAAARPEGLQGGCSAAERDRW